MKVLVTGGYGFIGSRLVRKLIRGGRRHTVVVVDDMSAGKRKFLADIAHRFSFLRVDIRNQKKLELLFRKVRPDAVAHLAAMHFIPDCNADPKKTLAINAEGTRTVVRLCNAYAVKKFIFASSASVYGARATPCTERSPARPVDIYGNSKLRAEKIIREECVSHWSIMRVFNVIGKNETHPHLIPSIISQLQHSRSITLGNLRSQRDYLYVDDLVDGILMLFHSDKGNSETINFGTGIGTTAREIITMLENITGRHIQIKTSHRLLRRADPSKLIAVNKKAERLLGWRPKFSLERALSAIVKSP